MSWAQTTCPNAVKLTGLIIAARKAFRQKSGAHFQTERDVKRFSMKARSETPGHRVFPNKCKQYIFNTIPILLLHVTTRTITPMDLQHHSEALKCHSADLAQTHLHCLLTETTIPGER